MIHEVQRELPTPDFSDLSLDAYLSPHPYLYYSPSRGCYWNRCAFCDYGLNDDAPTSPWRQDPVEKTVDDLRSLSALTSHVYLSVDVLAPATLHHLAERLSEERIDLRWGAEVRLERFWTLAKCRTLAAGGCTAISVGLESGSQRVLDAMDKGTSVEHMARTIGAMFQAGVAVQVMAFTGFPSETLTEALETASFLANRRQQWTLGDVGEFMLTPGAIVARQPDRFGVHEVRPRDGDDIHRSLLYAAPVETSQAERAEITKATDPLRIGDFDRPWVGGVDTPHSYFYHDRYGPRLAEVVSRALPRLAAQWSGSWQLNGLLLASPSGYQLRSHGGVLALERAPEGEVEQYFLRGDGRLFRLPSEVHEALSQVEETGAPSPPDELGAGDQNQVWGQAVRHHLVRPVYPCGAASVDRLATDSRVGC